LNWHNNVQFSSFNSDLLVQRNVNCCFVFCFLKIFFLWGRRLYLCYVCVIMLIFCNLPTACKVDTLEGTELCVVLWHIVVLDYDVYFVTMYRPNIFLFISCIISLII